MIPIIGSSISEAYSSLIGSINLIKGSVAIVGILVIIIINIPIIFDVLTYYIIFNLISYVADSLAVKRAADALKCFSSGMRILLLVCIFEMFIVIISTGILLSVKNGG
jgi:stage III sporulation protein AE